MIDKLGDIMIGLEYIRTTFGDTTTTLSQKLGISNVNISQWENGKKPIPDKRLDELHAIYQIPKNYFSKELSKLEELKVKWIKAHKELEESFVEIEEPIEFDSNMKPTKYATFNRCDENLSKHLREIQFKIEVETVIEEVREVVNNNLDKTIEDYNCRVDVMSANVDLVHKFVSLMKHNDIEFLSCIIKAVELSNNDSYCENSQNNTNSLIDKLVDDICEWKKAEKERLEAEYKEYKKLFNID